MLSFINLSFVREIWAIVLITSEDRYHLLISPQIQFNSGTTYVELGTHFTS
jgi:hypothetical protein